MEKIVETNSILPGWAITAGSITVVLVIPLIAVIFSMVWKRFQSHKEDIAKAHAIASEARDMGLIHQEQIKTLYNLAKEQATKEQLAALSKLIDEKMSNNIRLLESYNKTVEGARNELVKKHLLREERATEFAQKTIAQNTELIKQNNKLLKLDEENG